MMHDAQTIPSQLGQQTKSKVNTKFIAGGLLLLAFVVFLGYQMVLATTTTGAYYMTVEELANAGPSLVGERIRVNGNVVDGTEDWQAKAMTLKFSIIDEDNEASGDSEIATSDNHATLPIVFYGPRPDNFHRAASAIVEGRLLEDGTFQADNLLLKCPSRYEEEPEEIFVESTRG